LLYLITNRKLIKSGNIYSVVQNAVMGGVDRIILREKDLPYKKLLPIAAILKSILSTYGVPLIINSSLETALALNAEGFHIGFTNLPKEKPVFNGLLGVSVHNLQEAVLAEKYGADYLLAGHIFETNSKKGLKPKGIELIKTIKEKVSIPVIALGGINDENILEVLSVGADGIAVMSYIMASSNPFNSAKKLKDKINMHR